jgi:hypothetical protein
MDDKVMDIALGENVRKKKTILDNWDEITERLTMGQTIDLNTFVPDDNRRKRKNNDISKMLENKQKL